MSMHTVAQAEGQVGLISLQHHVFKNLQLPNHTADQTATLSPRVCGFLTPSQVVQRDSNPNQTR